MHFQSDDSDAFELLLNQQERFLIVRVQAMGMITVVWDLMFKRQEIIAELMRRFITDWMEKRID